ncbi:retrovirus-related pol polyprotein from transposon TNT 1-94 [Tanacetum coccineum]
MLKKVSLKFDKTNVSTQLVCVTPLNKKAFHKKTVAPKTEEKHVLSKTITLQTSPTKKKEAETNQNVIAPGMYKVTKQTKTNTKRVKSVLPSTRLRAASRVSIPLNRDSTSKNNVLSNTKKSSEKVEVSGRTNKKTYVASKNVVSNKKIVTGMDVENALKAKNVLCVSCAKNVLIPCHNKCLANYKLNVHSKVRSALFTTSRIIKSKLEDTTPVVSKTRFSVKNIQSKSLDTTSIVSKTKIAAVTPLSAKNKVSSTFNLRDSSLSNYMKNKIQSSRMWQKWYELQPNVGWSPVKTPSNVVNSPSTIKTSVSVKKKGSQIVHLSRYGQFCDGDLEVAFRSNTCYVQNLKGDDLLTGVRESNLYTISISDMVASSHGKSEKASHLPKVVPSNHSKLELLHMDLCGPMRAALINKKRQNRTLVEAARTMLIFSRLPEFLWAEAVSTACCTQNRSIIHTRYNKTPYELLHGRKPNVEYFHVFGSLCYPTNDRDDLGMMKPKADIEDLVNLFGPMYKEYFEKRFSDMSINSAAQQVHDHEDSPSTSLIIVEEHEAPPIVTTSKEQTSLISLNEADEFNQEDSTDFDGNTVFVPYDALNFEEAESSTIALDPSNMHEFYQVKPSTHIWTKAYPLE